MQLLKQKRYAEISAYRFFRNFFAKLCEAACFSTVFVLEFIWILVYLRRNTMKHQEILAKARQLARQFDM